MKDKLIALLLVATGSKNVSNFNCLGTFWWNAVGQNTAKSGRGDRFEWKFESLWSRQLNEVRSPDDLCIAL